jgi:hypothetical protein
MHHLLSPFVVPSAKIGARRWASHTNRLNNAGEIICLAAGRPPDPTNDTRFVSEPTGRGLNDGTFHYANFKFK